MLSISLADASLMAWYVAVLAFLEGLLSADNAIVLALMVRHLPKRDQRKVLMWGLWGAVGFRFIALCLSAILLKFWYFKVIGGGYLLYLAISHFAMREGHAAEGADGADSSGAEVGRTRRFMRGFWGTVLSVTLTDIAFSIDSILAAVAMAESFPSHFGDNGKFFIVFTGGVLGIITMRFVVRYFLVLLEKFPGLAEGAYCLVAWIGLKLLISGLHQAPYNGRTLIGFQMPEWLFWAGMILIAAISLIFGRGSGGAGKSEASRNLEIYDHEVADTTDTDPESGDDSSTDAREKRVAIKTEDS
jgi:YkoY family integral membrane protein